MRILVVTSSYPLFPGDSTAPFIESLVTHTARLGNEVHVVVPEHRDWNRPNEDGVSFHPFRYSPVRGWTPWGFSQALEEGTRLRRSLYAVAPLVGLSGVRACSRVIASRKIDVVHAHWLIPNGLLAAVASRRRGVPLVMTVHGSDVALSERRRWTRALARWSLRRSATTSAASQHLLGRVERLRGSPGGIELVPLGTDVDAFRPGGADAARVRERLGLGEGDVLVLGIGRLVRLKGFDHLLQATALLRDRAPDVRLVVVGDGDMRGELEGLARSLGIREIVTFVGAVGRTEVPGYFAAADVVAVPTVQHEDGYVEGFGYVVLEAGATGTPVVASRVGGLPEAVVDGETGILVPERDAAALADAIVTLAEDTGLRERLGADAHARARAAPSWEAVARQWVGIYERAIASQRR